LAAIRAPTPISSLVHSSTLVVAGVYILLQYRYCLMDILRVLLYISLLSLIVRSFGLLNENDIKKLIAFSTINHVSLIIYLLSYELYKVVYFHLNIHAIFKSLIFMCFGYVMLVSFHGQDKRIVRLLILNPVVKIIYYFSCLCIIGLPFLSAFFSKDIIIEKIIGEIIEMRFLLMLLLFLGISVYYRMKLLGLIFNQFSYQVVQNHVLSLLRVVIIGVSMVIFINIYISIIFSFSLEFLSYKLRIYLFIIIFLFLSL
jgi:NADH-ubiquinone oxidoreductase chain 5